MSTFTGPQHKGAMRAHRERKRAEAADRQLAFDLEVQIIAAEGPMDSGSARALANAARRLERAGASS